MRRYGIDSTVLVANRIEALLAIGEWDEAATASAAALRPITANFPYMLFMLRADLELGRGDFDAARDHLDAALASLREDRGQGIYDVYLAELALWERRWTDADQAVQDGLDTGAVTPGGAAAGVVLRQGTAGRRRAGRARPRPTRHRRRPVPGSPGPADSSPSPDVPPPRPRRSHPTPAAGSPSPKPSTSGPTASSQPASWAHAAAAWDRLERPPLAAYCRWREAEALVAAGASRTETAVPLRQAHTVAATIGAAPLQRELELLAQRARLDLTPPDTGPADRRTPLEHLLGLTPREAEVLRLVARGYTNREIAATLFISVKTASVHVSHILSKLDATNRPTPPRSPTASPPRPSRIPSAANQ